MGPTGSVNLLPSSTAVTRVSLRTGGAEIFTSGPKNSSYPSASNDDTIIGFITTAEDTPAPPNPPNCLVGDPASEDNCLNIHQMWVRNDASGIAYLASGRTWTATGRTTPGNGATERGSVTGNGQFAVFQSKADNFQAYINGALTDDDTAFDDVWIYDVQTFEMSRLSSLPADGTGANGRSWGPPEASQFGRYVTFTTRATDLVNVNTTGGNCSTRPRGGIDNIVLLDRGSSNLPVNSAGALAAREIRWVSHGITVQYALPGGEPHILDCVQPNGESNEPSLSANGCKIAYRSRASNLSLHDQFVQASPPIWHIYVYDAATGLNELVSKSTTGERANDDCFWPEVSADGRFVVFSSKARNLDPLDTNFREEIFVRDLQAGTTHLMNIAQDGNPFFALDPDDYTGGRNPEVSPSGRFVTYACLVEDPSISLQTGLRSLTTVLLYDRDANNTGVMSTDFDPMEFEVQHLSLIPDGQGGETDANGQTVGPLMFGADGKFIYFPSEASDLLPPGVDTNGAGLPGRDVFRRQVWQ